VGGLQRLCGGPSHRLTTRFLSTPKLDQEVVTALDAADIGVAGSKERPFFDTGSNPRTSLRVPAEDGTDGFGPLNGRHHAVLRFQASVAVEAVGRKRKWSDTPG
jgi:hypothetical protein